MELYKDYFTHLRRMCATCFHIQRNLYSAHKMHLHASYDTPKEQLSIPWSSLKMM